MIAEITGPVTTNEGVASPQHTMTRFTAILDGNPISVMYSTDRAHHGPPPELHEGQMIDLRGTIVKDPKGNRILLASLVEPATPTP